MISTPKTNLYKPEKRSFAFRFDNKILDPLVFEQLVFGIFLVNGHYSCGTHMRAGDISRGGLRLIRVTRSNHSAELDNAVLLNYALGPKSQRLKHKDICEKGTAPFMDAVVLRAKARGYQYWRTMTTGKSFGIPLDIYGLLDNGDLFCLIKGEKQAQGTRLFINGKGSSATTDMDSIYQKIGEKIQTSGMTTTGVMAFYRFGLDWEGFVNEVETNFSKAVNSIAGGK